MNKKGLTIIVLLAIIAVVAFVGFMVLRDSKPAQFEITDDALSIQCAFGVDVPLDEIENPELVSSMPSVAAKTNGAGVGSMQKGEYTLTDGRHARLYVDDTQPMFITFTYDDTVFFLNAATVEDTQTLFDTLQDAVNPS
jgi:cell division protein YceG involved in septum cleavage